MLEFIFEGGFMMYPITLLSVVGFAVIIDRFCAFRVAGRDNEALTRDVLEALLDKYMNSGIYEIEKTEILKLDPFLKFGKPAKIAEYFGGRAGYLQAVRELEKAIYEKVG